MNYESTIQSAGKCMLVYVLGELSDDIAPRLVKTISAERRTTFGLGTFPYTRQRSG